MGNLDSRKKLMVDSIKQNSPDRALKTFLKIFAKIIEETPMVPPFFNKIAAVSLEKGLHKFFSGGRGDFEKLKTMPLRKEKHKNTAHFSLQLISMPIHILR